jgi:molecular chaperone HtpG
MEKSMGATNAKVSNHIPEDLAFSILSKLPLKSLKRFGCVRKSWALLFENLHFLNMYRNYFISNEHSYYDGTSILLNQTNNPLPGEAFHSTLYLLSGERFENKIKLDWPPPFHEEDRFIHILSNVSVNGTLCLAQTHCMDPKCVFWNPTTDEFKIIPSSPFLYQSRFQEATVYFHGFGYDHVRDDYKVIRRLSFYPLTDTDYACEDYFCVDDMWEIYNLRSNSWTKLDIEMPFSTTEKLYVDGVCHWWSEHDDSNIDNAEPRLVSFDLCNEVFLTTPLLLDMIEHLYFSHLTLLNGFIAFIIYDPATTFHIRILGELGVKESWTKVFIVDPLPCIEHPIGAGKKDDIFFRKNDEELVWFDLSTQMIGELGVKGREHCCYIVVYKDSPLPIGGL